MLSYRAERMPLNLFVGKFTISRNALPLKASASNNFLTSVGLFGPPACGSFYSIGVSNNSVVLSTKHVDDSGVLLVDQILFAKLEFKLVGSVR